MYIKFERKYTQIANELSVKIIFTDINLIIARRGCVQVAARLDCGLGDPGSIPGIPSPRMGL